MVTGDEQERRKRWPKWPRRLLLVIVGMVGVPLMLLMVVVDSYLNNPVELPPALRAESSATAARGDAAALRRPAAPIKSAIMGEATSGTMAAVSTLSSASLTIVTGRPRDDGEDDVLIPLTTVGDPNLRGMAEEINRQATQLLGDLDQFERDRTAWQQANDPDTLPDAYWERRHRLLADYLKMGDRIDPSVRQRWNDLFLKHLIEHLDWYTAIDFCNNERRIDNWQTAVYCCQQMNPIDGSLNLGAHCVARVFGWIDGGLSGRADKGRSSQ